MDRPSNRHNIYEKKDAKKEASIKLAKMFSDRERAMAVGRSMIDRRRLNGER